MTERITSRRNPLLEQVRRLDTAALRRKAGVFLCDSPKLVGEAVQHGVSVQCVIAADGVAFPEGLPENVRRVTVPADVMASISPMPTPQGMLALCALPDMAAPARLSPGRYVVLDGVQDPGNVGAVLRTADAFGCTGALLLPGCADPYGPKTLRAAMGAVFRLPLYAVGLEALPGQMEQVLSHTEDIRAAAKWLAQEEDVFFIGRNLDYALSLEGSLKLKEISYIHSEAYASGELKHGTISLIRQGTPVIAVAAYLPLLDKAVSNVVEVQARGARVLALTTEAGAETLHKRVDTVLTVPEAEAMLLPQLGVIPLQLLSYYTALERGCDIDKPRNLAKSVTVE